MRRLEMMVSQTLEPRGGEGRGELERGGGGGGGGEVVLGSTDGSSLRFFGFVDEMEDLPGSAGFCQSPAVSTIERSQPRSQPMAGG